MNKWNDPARAIAYYFALANFVHFLGGLYIWEFVTNLGYEYAIITGKRKLTRSFPLYLGCRWFPLIAIVVQFIGFDSSHENDCQAMVTMTFAFAYLSFLFSSALIILRISALWQHNKVAITLASAFWTSNAICSIYSVATYRGRWTGSVCAVLHTERIKATTFSTFIADVGLLALMFIGVWRWKEPRGKGGVWWLLYTQGLVWVIVITLSEVPPVVFIILNLNGMSTSQSMPRPLTQRGTAEADTMNLMFQTSALIIMAIGAARIHRGLTEHSITNDPRAIKVNNKEWPREAKGWQPVSSHPHSSTTCTQSSGGLFLTGRGCDW
ncbi:hypothetical protein BJV78DRAFT_1350046 [Lactifluus subvellereus]|nr:hypothetical protein BJV78DRAFT_1350046 [Lactifluus subvellereus]